MNDDLLALIQTVTSQLLAIRFNFVCERDLQDGIEKVLREQGHTFSREFRFDAKDRIDFMVEGGLGLEVKIDRNLAQVTRQLHRYAQQSSVQGLLLVTSRLRLTNLPDFLNEKPIRSAWISGVNL